MNQENDPFYRDGRIYDLMHSSLVTDKDFFVQLAKKTGGPVLEVACGTGRITIPMALSGIETYGLDISEAMLSEARRKAQEFKVKVTWVQADCRKFELKKKFKFIFIPFNSMQHLHNRNSLESFFSCVKQHLAEDGLFLVDVFNPNIQLLGRDPTLRTKVMDLQDPLTGKTTYIEETMEYDVTVQVNRVKWIYSLEDQKDYKVDELNMRCFFPQELEQLMVSNGFEIYEKFGNFDSSPFTSKSPKQILLMKRTGIENEPART